MNSITKDLSAAVKYLRRYASGRTATAEPKEASSGGAPATQPQGVADHDQV
mgnify:CR=1 FL=1